MADYRALVTTSNNYLPALRPLAWLINKYWVPNPEVVVGGFAPPDFELPDNFAFHSIGDQADYPLNKWTDGLIDFVEAVNDEVFVLLLEDMWLTRAVDTRALDILAGYMHQFEYVARIDLTGDRLYAHGMRNYSTVGHLDLIVSMPGSPYHLSLMPGLWRKRHLLGCIKRGWSPWDVELQGTSVLSFNQDVLVLGTRQWPLRNTLAFRGGDSGRLLLDELDEADVDALRRLGYLSHWEEE